MKKGAKIAIWVGSVVVSLALIVTGVIMFPLWGEKNNEYWVATEEYTDENTVVIEKEPGKEFKILTLTDLQFSDVFDVFGKSKHAYDTTTKLINDTKPDLIVLTGDTVWTAFTKISVIKFTKFMDSFGIPWAPIFGNHEQEGNVSLNWVCDKFMESEHCLMRKGPNNIGGIGNYIINIKENDKTVESLFMFDSHDERFYSDIDKKAYDFIYEGQISWYKWAVEGIKKANNNENVPSMAFMHIPLPEFKDAYDMWEKTGFDKTIGFGEKRETQCVPPVNSGLFDVMKDLGSTTDVFAGHDHVNDYSVLYEGIRLTYVLKTGDRCYAEAGVNGGTVITIGENKTVEHVYIK